MFLTIEKKLNTQREKEEKIEEGRKGGRKSLKSPLWCKSVVIHE